MRNASCCVHCLPPNFLDHVYLRHPQLSMDWYPQHPHHDRQLTMSWMALDPHLDQYFVNTWLRLNQYLIDSWSTVVWVLADSHMYQLTLDIISAIVSWLLTKMSIKSWSSVNWSVHWKWHQFIYWKSFNTGWYFGSLGSQTWNLKKCGSGNDMRWVTVNVHKFNTYIYTIHLKNSQSCLSLLSWCYISIRLFRFCYNQWFYILVIILGILMFLFEILLLAIKYSAQFHLAASSAGGSSVDVTLYSCRVQLHQTLCVHCNLDSTTKRRKLELLSQYSLFGNIECLQAVRLAGNSRDSLLLSFKDAKVHHRYIMIEILPRLLDLLLSCYVEIFQE